MDILYKVNMTTTVNESLYANVTSSIIPKLNARFHYHTLY